METRPGLKRTLTAGLLAVAAAVGLGMPAVGRGAMPQPSIQQMIGVKDDERRRWRRTRADIMKRALTWRGIGMFSSGPRWPAAKARVVAGRQGVQASDGTKYVIWTDGSWRHQVQGPRSKRAVKRHRAERRRLAGLGRVVTPRVDGLLGRAIARAKAERVARDAAREARATAAA